MSLIRKLFEHITSVMDIAREYKIHFFKRRKNNTNLNTENYSYKIIKNIFQRKMLKQTKTQTSPSSQNNQRMPHSMKHDEDLFPSPRVYTGYTLGIDFI